MLPPHPQYIYNIALLTLASESSGSLVDSRQDSGLNQLDVPTPKSFSTPIQTLGPPHSVFDAMKGRRVSTDHCCCTAVLYENSSSLATAGTLLFLLVGPCPKHQSSLFRKICRHTRAIQQRLRNHHFLPSFLPDEPRLSERTSNEINRLSMRIHATAVVSLQKILLSYNKMVRGSMVRSN